MTVEFVTNASFLIGLNQGKRLLCDPWYSDGVYHGAWYNFPPLKNKKRYLDCKPDYIYISHLHPDHYDPETLAYFDPATEIWIGDLAHRHLELKLRALGFKNITAFKLGVPTKHQGLMVTIFGDFAGSSMGQQNDVNYALDTSLLIQDSDGTTLLNVNDNTIQEASAAEIYKQYGPMTVSIVPCSGASGYPHSYANYTYEQKISIKGKIREKMCSRFAGVASLLKSKWTIPAAGSYVLGGKLAPYNEFLHQPSPAYLIEFCKKFLQNTSLSILAEGDVLNTVSGAVEENPAAGFRNFSDEERLAYGLTLQDKLLSYEKFEIPHDFIIPWRLLLTRARQNLWQQQQKYNSFPNWYIRLNVPNAQQHFIFSLNQAEPVSVVPEDAKILTYEIDARLLLMVLNRAASWNNIEISALVEVRRMPDIFEPTIHYLMAFFHL